MGGYGKVVVAAVWLMLCSGASTTVEAAPDAGTRVQQMARPDSALANQAIATLPPSPYPAGCTKLRSNTRVVSQPIPSTQYYTVMPSSVDVRFGVRRGYDSLVQYINQGVIPYVMTPRAGQALNSPQFPGNAISNAPVLGAYVQESAQPLQSEGIGQTLINLPHGAIVREFSVGVRDASGKQDLHVLLEGFVGNGQGFGDLELESDCLAMGTYAKIGANNLAIPFDGRFAHAVTLDLIPARVPQASPAGGGVIQVDLITIGYTMQ